MKIPIALFAAPALLAVLSACAELPATPAASSPTTLPPMAVMAMMPLARPRSDVGNSSGPYTVIDGTSRAASSSRLSASGGSMPRRSSASQAPISLPCAV